MSGFNIYDRVLYKNVTGSSLASRSAFDGSVPYCVSCSAVQSQDASDSSYGVSAFFSVIGQANSIGVDSDEAHAGLVKQCVVNLHDLRVLCSGDGLFNVRITVCDPTDFPVSADHVYLYESQVSLVSAGEYEIKIPDITGIVIVGNDEHPLNVCVQLSTTGSRARSMSFHGVAVVDD